MIYGDKKSIPLTPMNSKIYTGTVTFDGKTKRMRVVSSRCRECTSAPGTHNVLTPQGRGDLVLINDRE